MVPRLLLAVALTLAANFQRGQGAAPVVPQPPTGTGAISGVVLDLDSQKPLAGAVVQLSGAPGPAPGATPGIAARPARQITDEQGRFVFARLPGNASYQLSAGKFGYFDGYYGHRSATGTNFTSARRIALAEGQWFLDARIELVKPAVITGAVTDDSGDPLVAVMVRAYTEVHIGGVRQLASGVSTTTDDRGMYRLTNLPPGRYIVAVPSVQHAAPAALTAQELFGSTTPASTQDALGREAPVRRDPAFALDPIHRLILLPNGPPPAPSVAGKPHAYPMTFHPSARTLADASTIQLRSGEERTVINVHLRPVPAFRLSGRLDGPPAAVSGMSLRLLTAGAEVLGRGNEQATALVASDSTFTFLNVPNGAYTILASRSVSEYVIQQSGFVNAPPPAPGVRSISMMSTAVATGSTGTMVVRHVAEGNSRFHGRQAVTVDGRDVSGVVVPMQAGVSMTGRIVWEDANGAAMEARPVVSVLASPVNGDLALGQPRSVMDPDDPPGYFYLDGLLPGQYLMSVLGGATLKSVTWNNKDCTDTGIDATGGTDIKGVVITMTLQTTVISGTIRNRKGEAAANTAAIVFPADRALWTNFGTQPARIRALTATTTGAFFVRGLPAGDYLIVAVDDSQVERWKDPSFFDAASRVASRISIGWGETKTQDLIVQEIR